jgi:signal transduction histidine kinase
MPPADRPDVFARATTRLVVLFTVIVILLVVASGVFFYLTVRTNITGVAQGSSGSGGETEVERVLATRSIDRVRWQLAALDGAIIVAVGALGYWYARRTLRPIRELYGAQKRFVADASHELRTPLAIMKADFEVALRGEVDSTGPAEQFEELRGALTDGLGEVDRMSAIVDDLLTLSRIDAHQEELRFAAVDLAELVSRTAEGMRTMAENARVALAVTAPDGAVPASADAAHLERALRNLLRNAIEHSAPGDTVAVDLAVAGDAAVTRVSDQGTGIAPADLAHVFDRFYRADSARSRDAGGSGLGLAITRWIVEGHGGTVAAESAPKAGTAVVVRLPLADSRDHGAGPATTPR